MSKEQVTDTYIGFLCSKKSKRSAARKRYSTSWGSPFKGSDNAEERTESKHNMSTHDFTYSVVFHNRKRKRSNLPLHLLTKKEGLPILPSLNILRIPYRAHTEHFRKERQVFLCSMSLITNDSTMGTCKRAWKIEVKTKEDDFRKSFTLSYIKELLFEYLHC